MKRAKRVRVKTTKEDENCEVFAASNVKLVAAAHSLKWKGIAQVLEHNAFSSSSCMDSVTFGTV